MTDGDSGRGHGWLTDRLLGAYRRYFGEPEELSEVYVGAGLIFGGVGLATFGVAVFLWSSTFPEPSGFYWQFREFAISAAMLALPAFLLGLTVLLPGDRRPVAGASLGALVCVAAVGLFVANYPYNWNAPGPDASALGVAVYAVGVVLSAAAVGGALVANYVTLATPRAPASTGEADGADAAAGPAREAGGTAAGDGSESVTEEQVRADIEAALSGTDLTWGGVETDDTRRLNVRTEDPEMDSSGVENVDVPEDRAEGEAVDAAVDGLRELRGGQVTEATGEGTDEQADALNQVREQQARREEEAPEGTIDRLRDRIGL